MRRTRFDRVRVYETLRSAHLERARALAPSSILYRRRRYDFDASLAAGVDLQQVGTFQMMVVLIASRVRQLEVNEPLMRGGLRRTVLAIVVAKASASVTGRRLIVGAYAIENRDPYTAGPDGGSTRSHVSRWLDRRLSVAAASHLDRIVYGTEAARRLYAEALPQLQARSVVIAALPSPCGCGTAEDDDERPRAEDAATVLYLGALTSRKGFDRLLAAWPLLAGPTGTTWELADVRLDIVGKGPLEAEALALAEVDARVRVSIDPARTEVHAHLRRAAVLVLLSQPTEHWREQVGLPITEALAHGCAVVTTTETGLAGWLADHGHQVIPPDSSGAAVAAAIRRALQWRATRDGNDSDLPTVDGRIAADSWLFDGPDDA